MRALRAIVFDLDDTLYPERCYVFSGFKEVARWCEECLGIPADTVFEELCQLFETRVRGNTFDRWLAIHGIRDEDIVPKMVKVYRGHVPNIAPYSGVPELLHRFGKSYRLGLLTDGYLEAQKRKLTTLGLETCFEAIVFSDELGQASWKPNHKPFEVVLSRLRVAPNKAVYVADNPAKDFLGARQVGMTTIRVRHPDGLYADMEPPSPTHAPDVEIPSLDSLEAMLLSSINRKTVTFAQKG